MKNTSFIIREGIVFTVETSGAAIVNTLTKSRHFINYPEAAVWLIMAENNDVNNLEKLKAVLGMNDTDAMVYINGKLEEWKNMNLIH